MTKPTIRVREVAAEYLRHDDVVKYCAGSHQLVGALIKAGWLAPVLKRHKMTIYRLDQVQHAMHRLEAEGFSALAAAVV